MSKVSSDRSRAPDWLARGPWPGPVRTFGTVTMTKPKPDVTCAPAPLTDGSVRGIRNYTATV